MMKLPLLLNQTCSQPLYEQLAERIEQLIQEGTLNSGDRLPSVRKLHQQLQVSISTILEAYRLLEDRGLIRARPQSGYYVKANANHFLAEPTPSTPSLNVCSVDTSLAFQINNAVRYPDVIKLGAAVPSPELFPKKTLNRMMGQVIRTHPEMVHAYDMSPGCELLRQQVAKRLIEAGCSISPEEVVTTNGATEAVYLSLKAVTQPGDTVAIESPTYSGLLEILDALHLQALELPTHPREGLCLNHLETALKEKKIAACAVVSNFSNPLGTCMSDEKKQQLVNLMNVYDTPLIEDDIYGELYHHGNRPKALKAFDQGGNVLYCASVSKTLSPGLRVGWAIPGQSIKKVKALKMTMNLTCAIAPQLTVATFFANGGYDHHLRRLRSAYRVQMEQMQAVITHSFPRETCISRPEGGHVLWLELNPDFDAMALYEKALQEKISISPGIIFSPSRSYRNCLRLNCGLPWSPAVEEALKTLGNLTHQLIQPCKPG